MGIQVNEQQKLSKMEMAYNKIRKDIITNRLKPQSVINESKICTELGISRTPVRGALQKLTFEGLIEYVPDRGMFVSMFKFTDLLEIAEVRIPNECLAVKLATERMTEEDLDELEKCIGLQVKVNSEDNAEKAYEMDNLFHKLIARGSKNTKLAHICIDLVELSGRGTYFTKKDPERIQHAAKMHEDVFKAIKERDPDKASSLMRKHLLDWVEYSKNQQMENFYMFK